MNSKWELPISQLVVGALILLLELNYEVACSKSAQARTIEVAFLLTLLLCLDVSVYSFFEVFFAFTMINLCTMVDY